MGKIIHISNYQSLANNPQKTQFEEMQESFNEVLKEHNDSIDSSTVAKDMQKSYMKLFSQIDKK